MQYFHSELGKLAFKTFGKKESPPIVIMPAMGAVAAEWWHIAEDLGQTYFVVVYDRFGYGTSDHPKTERSAKNVAIELHFLLQYLHVDRLILIGHSLGGLYAQQYVRLYHNEIQALILLDPVCATNRRFLEELTPEEFAKSGIDKRSNMKMGLIFSTIGIIRLFRSLFKTAPPFYYFNQFSKDAEKTILNALMQRKLYKTTIKEYAYLDNEEAMQLIMDKSTFPSSLPIVLLCHSPEIMIKEIEDYGGADHITAQKVDDLWIRLMKIYLEFSIKASYLQSLKSSHFIHLSDPELLYDAIRRIQPFL